MAGVTSMGDLTEERRSKLFSSPFEAAHIHSALEVYGMGDTGSMAEHLVSADDTDMIITDIPDYFLMQQIQHAQMLANRHASGPMQMTSKGMNAAPTSSNPCNAFNNALARTKRWRSPSPISSSDGSDDEDVHVHVGKRIRPEEDLNVDVKSVESSPIRSVVRGMAKRKHFDESSEEEEGDETDDDSDGEEAPKKPCYSARLDAMARGVSATADMVAKVKVKDGVEAPNVVWGGFTSSTTTQSAGVAGPLSGTFSPAPVPDPINADREGDMVMEVSSTTHALKQGLSSATATRSKPAKLSAVQILYGALADDATFQASLGLSTDAMLALSQQPIEEACDLAREEYYINQGVEMEERYGKDLAFEIARRQIALSIIACERMRLVG